MFESWSFLSEGEDSFFFLFSVMLGHVSNSKASHKWMLEITNVVFREASSYYFPFIERTNLFFTLCVRRMGYHKVSKRIIHLINMYKGVKNNLPFITSHIVLPPPSSLWHKHMKKKLSLSIKENEPIVGKNTIMTQFCMEGISLLSLHCPLKLQTLEEKA